MKHLCGASRRLVALQPPGYWVVLSPHHPSCLQWHEAKEMKAKLPVLTFHRALQKRGKWICHHLQASPGHRAHGSGQGVLRDVNPLLCLALREAASVHVVLP